MCVCNTDTCTSYYLLSSVIFMHCRSWVKLGLPVSRDLLKRSKEYMCFLVARFVNLTLEEASKITGILVSIKCARTNQVCENLWYPVLDMEGVWRLRSTYFGLASPS